jgi:hypothetical protein
MAGNKFLKSTKEITLLSVLTTILFVQEQLLAAIPGVQLTVFLIVLYAKKLGLVRSSIIVVLYVILDNFFMSTFSFIYTPVMLIGWLIIPILLSTVFKKIEKPILLGLLGIMFSFLYSWLYIIPTCIIANIDFFVYFLTDVVFEIILAICSFISILVLYKPCSKVFDILMKNKITES